MTPQGNRQVGFRALRDRTASPSFLPSALLRAGRDAVLKAVLLRSELVLSLSKGEARVSKDTASGDFAIALAVTPTPAPVLRAGLPRNAREGAAHHPLLILSPFI